MSEQPNPYRLTKSVIPSRYDLVLEPDLDAATFKGEVVIAVELAAAPAAAAPEPITQITLNAAELEITTATVTQAGQTHAATVTLQEENERAVLELEPGLLVPGAAEIACSFTGVLNDKLRGFYRSTYTTDDDQKRSIATTQFESTNARRSFPCFDEPDFKAIFGVTLIVPEHLNAISCGELLSVEPEPAPTAEPTAEPATASAAARNRYHFADTMVMSTYLLAFIVGDLEATEPVDVGGVPLRIVHVPGKSHLTKFAVEVGSFALNWLVDYYGIDYPGTKLDLVAVPDFAFGAMENMGCITFRETLLLADPPTSTLAELSRIVDVVAHEIAHMWFGNLVTMDWWNGIWLKEAFATFMQISTTHAFRPQWHRWDEFSLERGAAFDVDSLSSTRPIEFDVVSPADAEGMYDVLTYEKGAAVVRMLEQFLQPEEFRAGVQHYLETFSYRNVTTTDLWEALESATGQPVAAAMGTWIFQGGYPIIDVEPSPAPAGGGGKASGGGKAGASKAGAGKAKKGAGQGGGVVLSQRRFEYGLPADAASDVASDAPLWHVPVTIRALLDTGERVERRVLLTEPTTTVDLGGQCEWVDVNAGGSRLLSGALRTRVAGTANAASARRADRRGALRPRRRHLRHHARQPNHPGAVR